MICVKFSFEDIFKALINIKRTKFKYILTTNFYNRNKNLDIATGSWRRLNLSKDPFNFPEPCFTITENCTEENSFDKSLSLWELKKIPNFK